MHDTHHVKNFFKCRAPLGCPWRHPNTAKVLLAEPSNLKKERKTSSKLIMTFLLYFQVQDNLGVLLIPHRVILWRCRQCRLEPTTPITHTWVTPTPWDKDIPTHSSSIQVRISSQFHTKFSRHIPICSESSRIINNLANHQTSQQQWCFWRDFESFFKWWNVYMNTDTGRVMFSILTSDL